ncbi:hypothetical protein EVAR_98399_1 [Eumeta japonica]|uniref:C2H2-type domain-containing protein n=1 Tax=Eumeta variegata TaxID=151549 RepID=A0A4C1XP28_EUMVA|nr:hypothetical protein EVAR_98399_1 [Eumeta japonica]
MGSKVPSVAKMKRQGLSCEDCSAKFPNLSVLKKHRLKAHKKTRANKVSVPKGDKQALSGVKKIEKAKTAKKAAGSKKTITKSSTEKRLSQQTDPRCHVCRKLFPTRSEMLDHYKAAHLRSSDHVKTKVDVAMNKLMNTVKKVTQDHSKCVKCSKIFATRRSMLLHICQNIDESREQYRCAGCKEKFDSLEKLDAHIVTDHNENIEILVFKDEDEFQAWKKKEEDAIKINYVTMSSADKASTVYRCSASVKSDGKDNVKEICPSAIILRASKDFLKASFYKSHHGHPCDEFEFQYSKEKSDQDIESTKLSKTSNMESSMDIENKDTESDEAFESDLKLYKCLACDQTFNSMKQLNFHLNGAHNDDIYSILFPNNEEFETWKIKMQNMTKTSYLPGLKYDQKMYYNCDAPFKATTQIGENGLEWVIKKVCPSTIVTKQYDRGLQIHFYKRHYDHEHTEYVPTNEIRKYDIKSMFSHNSKRKTIYMPEYKKLKTLLVEVLSIAENLPISNLKMLISEANGIAQKAKDFLGKDQKSPLGDEQKDLPEKEKIPNEGKRKLENIETDKDTTEELRTSKRLRGRSSKKERPPVKRTPVKNLIKKSTHRTKSSSINTNIPITIAPKIVNTFTLATDFKEPIKDIGSISMEPNTNGIERDESAQTDTESIQPEPLETNTADPRKKYELLLSTSTFNDSYKTFIESKSWGSKSEKNKANKDVSESPKVESEQTIKKKNVRMKTKLGQYSPKNKLSKTPIKTSSPVKPISTSVVGKPHITQVPRKHPSTSVHGKSPNIRVHGKSHSTPKTAKPASAPILGKFKVERSKEHESYRKLDGHRCPRTPTTPEQSLIY